VVLDLLRTPSRGEILGYDASNRVVEALAARKIRDGRRWQAIEADAFELPKILGDNAVDTVVFCSVLHEIYSYVPYPSARRECGSGFVWRRCENLLKAALPHAGPGRADTALRLQRRAYHNGARAVIPTIQRCPPGDGQLWPH